MSFPALHRAAQRTPRGRPSGRRGGLPGALPAGGWYLFLAARRPRPGAERTRCWRHPTDHATPHEEALEVKRRKIRVPVVAKGAARLSYAELCGRPHGAEDYLTLARTYHTLFLEEVPELDDDHRNEAKRLLTLIDALYDTRTRLVVTAGSTTRTPLSGPRPSPSTSNAPSAVCVRCRAKLYLRSGK